MSNDVPLVLQSSASAGLPLTLNGASIAVAVNGVTTHPALYYATPTQIPPFCLRIRRREMALTVTYQGLASAAIPILVVPSAPGLNTYGTDTAVATHGVTGAVLTFNNSGTPGEAIATGLGSGPADSDTTYSPAPHAVNTNVQVYIGGVAAQVLYKGSAGYPGVNQINVIVPNKVSGCWVAVAVVAGTLVAM